MLTSSDRATRANACRLQRCSTGIKPHCGIQPDHQQRKDQGGWSKDSPIGNPGRRKQDDRAQHDEKQQQGIEQHLL